MNLDDIEIPKKLVPRNYLQQGLAAQRFKQRQVKELLEKRKLPELGWRDEEIEELVHQLAALDSNNFPYNIGLGEREARIVCKLVARRHYNFGHGIGRSGDLLEAQPKAAGSTLLASLTNALLLDLLHMLGLLSCRGCFLVPLATGMTLTLCLQAMRKHRPTAKYVLWSRIDQKSCFKAIIAAGLEPIIIPCLLQSQSQSLITDCQKFEQYIQELGANNVLCLYSTTSCFAPRNCDLIVELAKLAKNAGVPNIVNNAYGLQSEAIVKQLERAQRVGRIDYFVQSTDKNLLVPVGGAIVASSDEHLLIQLANSYAGRASSSQTLDVFMTLLSLGRSGYQSLLSEREQNFEYLKQRLQQFATEHNEIVPQSIDNHISLALSLRSVNAGIEAGNITKLGAMLHTRGVSGARVIDVGQTKTIDGHEFKSFGSHREFLEVPYLTVAAALGIKRADIDKFFIVLNECWTLLEKQSSQELEC